VKLEAELSDAMAPLSDKLIDTVGRTEIRIKDFCMQQTWFIEEHERIRGSLNGLVQKLQHISVSNVSPVDVDGVKAALGPLSTLAAVSRNHLAVASELSKGPSRLCVARSSAAVADMDPDGSLGIALDDELSAEDYEAAFIHEAIGMGSMDEALSCARKASYSTSSVTQHRRLLDVVGYSTSSVTQHRRLLNIVGDSTSPTLSTIEIRRLIKNIQDD
jgi:hypothetical protein